MKIASGAASGHATLRRDRGSATLSGTLRAERLPISRAGFSGRIGGTLEFASTGKSPAALVAGLAGGGTAQLVGAELARSDPAALDRVVARTEAPEAQLDETNIAYALGQELDKAPLKIPDGAAPLSLSAGTIKFGPLPIARPHGDATLSASFDLSTLSLETRLLVTSPSADLKFWSGPPPSATVTVQDALSAPKRRARRRRARGGSRDPGDSARDRPHRQPRCRHSRARFLQPPAEGRAVHGAAQGGSRGLARRAGAAEGRRRAARDRARRGGEGRGGKGGGEKCRREGRDGEAAAERAAEEKAAAEKVRCAKLEAGKAFPRPSFRRTSRANRARADAAAPSSAPTPPRRAAPFRCRPRGRSRAPPRRPRPTRPRAASTERPAARPTRFRGARASSTKTLSADDRLASPRAASTRGGERVDRQPAFGGDRLQAAPEGVLERNAGAMAGDDERALDDPRAVVSRHRDGRACGRRDRARPSRARCRAGAARLWSFRTRCGFRRPWPLCGGAPGFCAPGAG